MKSYFKTDIPRVTLYMNENANWQKTLTDQCNELPVLEKMLGDAMEKVDILEESEIGVDTHFRRQLVEQQQEITMLNNELSYQQQRLANDSKKNLTYDTHALCSQDILRDKIKDVEKKYVELKCNFMKFLSTVL